MGKFLFLSYFSKYSCSIRFQHSFNCHIKNESKDFVDFLRVVRNLWKLRIDHVILIGCGQACPCMPEVETKNK